MAYAAAEWINAHNPDALAVGDLDSNGAPDIAVAAEFRGLLTLRHRADVSEAVQLPGRDDFSFYTVITDQFGELRAGAPNPQCIAETACVNGAIPERSEVFLRIVGPKPNGYLWPTMVKFTTSEVEVWAVQEATRRTLYYRLPGSRYGDDRLIGLFDMDGFRPMSDGAGAAARRGGEVPPAPTGEFLTSPEVPGFRFKIQIRADGEIQPTRAEPQCIPETLCVSGAVPSRPELFVRIVGPKPNGYLRPTLVRFSTSEIEIWVEQTATGETRYYRLAPAHREGGELIGLFDRYGFSP